MARCEDKHCNFISEIIGDIKPYPIDRDLEMVYTIANKEHFYKLCNKCFNDYNKEDMDLYKQIDKPIKAISWEEPTGITNSIINITNNHYHNNITNNNLIDYNTTNNINNTSNYYNSPVATNKKTNNDLFGYTPKKHRPQKEDNEVATSNNEEALFNKLIFRFNKTKYTNDNNENETYIRGAELKQQEFERQQALQEKQYNDKINQEVVQRKDKKRRDIETAKMFHPNAKEFSPCIKCNVYKAFPEDFLTKSGNVPSKDLCYECNSLRTEKYNAFKKDKMRVCACGVSYLCTDIDKQIIHESTDRHKKALLRNQDVKGVKYNISQLRQICNHNKIINASRMNKEEIIKKLNEIDNLLIPEFKN